MNLDRFACDWRDDSWYPMVDEHLKIHSAEHLQPNFCAECRVLEKAFLKHLEACQKCAAIPIRLEPALFLLRKINVIVELVKSKFGENNPNVRQFVSQADALRSMIVSVMGAESESSN